MDNKVTVKYDAAPRGCGCDFLTNVGYWNDRINILTYSKEPLPLTMNCEYVTAAVAVDLVLAIREQLPHENGMYVVEPFNDES